MAAIAFASCLAGVSRGSARTAPARTASVRVAGSRAIAISRSDGKTVRRSETNPSP